MITSQFINFSRNAKILITFCAMPFGHDLSLRQRYTIYDAKITEWEAVHTV